MANTLSIGSGYYPWGNYSPPYYPYYPAPYPYYPVPNVSPGPNVCPGCGRCKDCGQVGPQVSPPLGTIYVTCSNT